MRNHNRLLSLVLTLLMFPVSLWAQSNSLNTFSPYTFYALGDFSTVGSTALRSMGGVGVGYSHQRKANYLNPASYGEINPKSVLFSVGLEGGGHYLNTATSQSSYNPFNFREVSMRIPLAPKVGMGISVTPYSSVGYRLRMYETDPQLVANLGSIRYDYGGEGNLIQAKASFGAELFKDLKLGAEVLYYHGHIERTYDVIASPLAGSPNMRSQYGYSTHDYSRAWVNMGLQYALIRNDLQRLTLGLSYSPKLNLRPKVYEELLAQNIFLDTISASRSRQDFYLPTDIKTGLFYVSRQLSAGVDYQYQGWKGINPNNANDNVTFRNTHTLKAGLQYLPNEYDPRYYYRRVSYRIGYRYSNYYMNFNGQAVNDNAITFGVGIPFRQGLSCIDLGAELGQRGSTATGMIGLKPFEMVRDRYFMLSIGLTLFGEDYWFIKHKYD